MGVSAPGSSLRRAIQAPGSGSRVLPGAPPGGGKLAPGWPRPTGPFPPSEACPRGKGQAFRMAPPPKGPGRVLALRSGAAKSWGAGPACSPYASREGPTSLLSISQFLRRASLPPSVPCVERLLVNICPPLCKLQETGSCTRRILSLPENRAEAGNEGQMDP